MGMSVFFASTEEKIAVQNLGTLFISCSLIPNSHRMDIDLF
jgi:hypothetical protein